MFFKTLLFRYILMATSITFTGCHSQLLNAKKNTIGKYQLEYTMPIVKDDGSVFILNDKIQVFQNNDFSLYRLPHFYTLEKDQKLLKEETRYSVFVFKKGGRFGDYYKDDSTGSSVKKENVDSVLIQRAFSTMDFYNPELLNMINRSNDANVITQIYVPKKKEEELGYDSIYVFFNKQAVGIDYSLSKKLDTIANYKLYKFNIICSPFYSKKYSLSFPRQEFIFELTRFNEISTEENKYFKTYTDQWEKGN